MKPPWQTTASGPMLERVESGVTAHKTLPDCVRKLSAAAVAGQSSAAAINPQAATATAMNLIPTPSLGDRLRSLLVSVATVVASWSSFAKSTVPLRAWRPKSAVFLFSSRFRDQPARRGLIVAETVLAGRLMWRARRSDATAAGRDRAAPP